MIIKKSQNFFQKYAGHTLYLIILAGAVLISIPPWHKFFFTGLANHWDPSLMGQWMAWNAGNILHGHVLFPEFNANFFYPHAYSLAFSEELWPESFLFALLYRISGNFFFSFNLVMLVFWSVSGITMYALLRELDIGKTVSWFGGFVTCLIPYRMQYYVEFNMVLVFIIPLLLVLWIRWLKKPTVKRAVGVVAGFWLSVTSCIYFTLMSLVLLFFVTLTFILHFRKHLFSRATILPLMVVILGCLMVGAAYLYPYGVLRIRGGYVRSPADCLKNHAQVMHYLDTSHSAILHRLVSVPPMRMVETSLFPGTTLSLMIIFFLVDRLYSFINYYRRKSALFNWLAFAKVLSWLLFIFFIIFYAYSGKMNGLSSWGHWLYGLSYLLIFLSILSCLQPRVKDQYEVIRLGFAAAAVCCFFISLGPVISVGSDFHRIDLARGPFADFFTWVPIFGAVRVVSRFSIIVLLYFIVIGCMTFNKWSKSRKWLLVSMPILLGMLVFEAAKMDYNYADYSYLIRDPVIREAMVQPGKKVICQLPVGPRRVAAKLVLATSDSCPLLINGYSGFSPKYLQRLYTWEKNGWQLAKITGWLREIWPPVYLLFDKRAVLLLAWGWKKQFPYNQLDQQWNLVTQDNRYALYSLPHKENSSKQINRIVRTDLLRKNSRLQFSACLTGEHTFPPTVSVLVNGHLCQRKILFQGWHTYVCHLPLKFINRLQGNIVTIQLNVREESPGSPSYWKVRDINFYPLKKS